MKTVFVSAGPYSWGSSRMRCYWPAKYMRDTQVVERRLLTRATPADVMIWQKLVDLDFIEAYPNRKHYWDVCDPSWWWEPDGCREIADKVAGVVASSEALRDDFNSWYGKDKAICIPDRIDLDHFPKQRVHADVSPVRFIWYGVAVNRIALFAQLANLERLSANGYNISLTVFDDRPDVLAQVTDSFPVENVKWDIERENEVLSAHDIALLPPYPGPWGKVKSNNKQLTASANNLPVVSDQDYYRLVEYMRCDLRAWDADTGRNHVSNHFTADKSAREWEALLNG